MKALVSLGDRVEVQDVPEPSPGPGEVVLAVHSCGICGSDVHSVEGGAARPGQIMGHELAGTIAELGTGVADWHVGQQVAVNPLGACGECEWCARELSIRCRNRPNIGLSVPGGFAERIVAPIDQLVALPEHMSPELGARVEPLAVALRGIRETQLAAGDSVLVYGAGPIGLNTILGARALGAGTIVAVEPSATRRGAALAVGADRAVDASEPLDGRFDHAFDCAGAPPVLAACVEHVREGGTIVLVALGRTPSPLSTRQFVAKNLRMVSSTAFGPREFQHAFEMIASGTADVRPLTTERVSLHAAPEAFVRLRAPEGAVGILVQPWLSPSSH